MADPCTVVGSYGTTEITGFERSKYCTWRYGIWRASADTLARLGGPAQERVRTMAAGPGDLSPVVSTYAHQLGKVGDYVRPYDSRCSCCYLGISHTTALHDSRTQRAA